LELISSHEVTFLEECFEIVNFRGAVVDLRGRNILCNRQQISSNLVLQDVEPIVVIALCGGFCVDKLGAGLNKCSKGLRWVAVVRGTEGFADLAGIV
jgi:hypothetical protein